MFALGQPKTVSCNKILHDNLVTPTIYNRCIEGDDIGVPMGETVHIIPVGFDYERLLHPISKGNLDADRVRILHSARTTDDPEIRELAETMVEKLEYAFESHLDIETHVETVEDIFEYKLAYQKAHEMITKEIDDENDIWINISSMPRTVAFAFATAANALIIENTERRDRIHTYYVSPERYFVIDMLNELRDERTFLKTLNERYDDHEIEERLDAITTLLSNIDRSGITRGAKEMATGERHLEIPAAPLPELRDFEIAILGFLDDSGPMESTSRLAKALADRLDEDPDSESFRSKVQYNVGKLEAKGFINREKAEKSFKTELSTMGELWLATHNENGDNKIPA